MTTVSASGPPTKGGHSGGANPLSSHHSDTAVSLPEEANSPFKADSDEDLETNLENVIIEQGPANSSNDSGSSEDVEIYLNDLCISSGQGLDSLEEPSVDESPLLPSGPRLSSHVPYTHIQSFQLALTQAPLLIPSQKSAINTSVTAQTTTATGSTTPTFSTTSSGPVGDPDSAVVTSTPPRSTTNTTSHTKGSLSVPRTSTPRDLLSPVTDLDSPRVPPVTRMSTIPLPEYDDDPILSLPTSMEELELSQGRISSRPQLYSIPNDGRKGVQLRTSPQENLRTRPLSVKMPGTIGLSALATPPPSSPLPGLPGSPVSSGFPTTSPLHIGYFSGSAPVAAADHLVSPTTSYNTPPNTSPSSVGSSASNMSGSSPSTPNFASMQSSSIYTQSQPLPQLPTFAPALSAISERNISKDDNDVSLDVERRVIKKGASGSPDWIEGHTKGCDDAFASNRSDHPFGSDNQSSHQNPQAHPSLLSQRQPQTDGSQYQQHLGMPPPSNVTLTANHQQYGTITVSNSVVSFPSSTLPPVSVAPCVASPLAQDDSFGSAQSHSVSPVPNGLVGFESVAAAQGDSQKTPNVYINGLPPHFPEDQLYALAAPFGEVKSVRTFTRHVRESESGYGFVLFATVEGAERCITSLRRYRNLHPTFSKQIHKIPGTVYAQAKLQPGASSSGSPSMHHGWDGSDDGDASFKARMEALADPLSTNLYMEGLPINIDEPTLSALVSPHRIVSSRFFQTRLSNPPRIIAFVRLDTRHGAEEVIERLHGRMVRGQNDAGSRISVRFADTSEQRELRRQERTAQEGGAIADAPPARLSMAQAALLNLRGQDLRKEPPSVSTSPSPIPQASNSNAQAPVYPIIGQQGLDWNGRDSYPLYTKGSAGQDVIGDYPVDISLGSTFSPGSALASGSGLRSARLGNGAPDVEYASAFAGGPLGVAAAHHHRHHHPLDGANPAPFRINYSLAPNHALVEQMQPQAQGDMAPMDPIMKNLLASLSGNGSVSTPNDQCELLYRQQVEQEMQQEYHNHQQQQQALYGHPSATGQLLQYPTSYGVASTRTGYTATEESIMRNHLERQTPYSLSGTDPALQTAILLQQQQQRKQRPAPLDLARQPPRKGGGETNANFGMGFRGFRGQGSLAGMSEEEAFHAQGASMFGPRSSGGDGSEVQQQQPRMSRDLSQSRHAPASAVETPFSSHAHSRSATLPHRNSVGSVVQFSAQRQHFARNSVSMQSPTALRTSQHAPSAATPAEADAGQGGTQSHLRRGSLGAEAALGGLNNNNGNGSKTHLSSFRTQNLGQRQDYEDNTNNSPSSSSHSPSMISPALTYSSQAHTPSTLSPATPFFGSFNSQNEGFKDVDSSVGAKGEVKPTLGGLKGPPGGKMGHSQQASSGR